jgi:flagellar basal body-associated protein FliL
MANEDFESQEELGLGGKAKNWIQDNIRIIISVLIVVVIAGGIYSYSNRSQDSISKDELALEDEFMIDQELEEDAELAEVQEIDAEEDAAGVQIDEESAEVEVETISQETGEAFVETAVAGDGSTTLARKALVSYLEKNNDSELTAEHKIYIEDYLRKNVNHTGGVAVGSQISFSKNLIKDSIEKSKTLNAGQLKNLEKYSARVASLR